MHLANSLDLKFTSLMQDFSDEQLMCQYAKGDAQAFEQLYARHKGGLFRYCLRQFQNQPIAQECFQEIWLKLINSRANYQPTALFTTYLYRIAKNHVIDLVRKQNKTKNEVTLQEEIDPADFNQQAQGDVVDRLSEEKIYASLRKQIELLPMEQKTALLLKIDAGLSLEQIAVILDCGRETVKSRLRYATKHLKKQLGKCL